MQRRTLIATALLALAATQRALAHHGWSSFDQTKPIWLEGKAAKVSWGNPHAEIELEVSADLRLPADLSSRALPAQSAAVDGAALLKSAQVPRRKDRRWEIELAPLTRLEAWKVPQIKPGDSLAVIGFTLTGETGAAVLRAEYLFVGGQVYGLRSSPV